VQESGLKPDAVSRGVGAQGVMQIMPGTWADIQRAMGWKNVSPFSAHHNIFGGVYYQSRMNRQWSRNRSLMDINDLGLASYNAGLGNILKAQALCNDARLWSDISTCLLLVTGKANAKQTKDYVRLIARWRSTMGDALCPWSGHRGGCGPVREGS
jgi:soluble lytic murein transglycosylase-like protein